MMSEVCARYDNFSDCFEIKYHCNGVLVYFDMSVKSLKQVHTLLKDKIPKTKMDGIKQE